MAGAEEIFAKAVLVGDPLQWESADCSLKTLVAGAMNDVDLSSGAGFHPTAAATTTITGETNTGVAIQLDVWDTTGWVRHHHICRLRHTVYVQAGGAL